MQDTHASSHPLIALWAVAFDTKVTLGHQGSEWTCSLSNQGCSLGNQGEEGQGYSLERALQDTERKLSARLGHCYWEKLLDAALHLMEMDPEGGNHIGFWSDKYKQYGPSQGFERVPVSLSHSYLHTTTGTDLKEFLPFLRPKPSFMTELPADVFVTMMENATWRAELSHQANNNDPDCGFYQSLGHVFPGRDVRMTDPKLLERLMQVAPAPTDKAYAALLTGKRTEPIISAMVQHWGLPSELSIIQIVRTNMNNVWPHLVTHGYQASDHTTYDLVRFGQYDKLAQVSTREQRVTQARKWACMGEPGVKIQQQELGSRYKALSYLLTDAGATPEEVTRTLDGYPSPREERNILRREALRQDIARRIQDVPPEEAMSTDGLDLT